MRPCIEFAARKLGRSWDMKPKTIAVALIDKVSEMDPIIADYKDYILSMDVESQKEAIETLESAEKLLEVLRGKFAKVAVKTVILKK